MIWILWLACVVNMIMNIIITYAMRRNKRNIEIEMDECFNKISDIEKESKR